MPAFPLQWRHSIVPAALTEIRLTKGSAAMPDGETTALSAEERTALILKYRPYAISFARRWGSRSRSKLGADELTSICLLAIAKAAAAFDPSRGMAFPTYAFWHLKMACRREMRMDLQRGFRNLPAKFELNQIVNDDHGRPIIGEDLADREPGPHDDVTRQDGFWEKHIEPVASERLRRVLLLYYRDGKTRAEIAKELNVTPQHVSIMRLMAIEQIRKAVQDEGFDSLD